MSFLIFLIGAVELIIIVDAIASWIVKPGQFPRTITGVLTDPLYRPVRKLMGSSTGGGMDWSPLILLIALQVVRNLLLRGL